MIKRILFFLILFAGCSLPCMAQTYTPYGGLLVGSNSVTANGCPARGASGTLPAAITATITQHARSSNVATLTVSATLTGWEPTNAPIIVIDSTDSSFNTPTATNVDITLATTSSGTTITYSNSGANVSTTTATGTVTLARWYEAKITLNSAYGSAVTGQTHWMLCDPWGAAMFMNVNQVDYPGAIVGALYGGNWPTVFSQKYGTIYAPSSATDWEGNFGFVTNLRMKAMGFNGIDSTTAWNSVWQGCGNYTTGCMPEAGRMMQLFQPGDPYSFTDSNRFGYVLEPIQQLYDAVKSSLVPIAYDRGLPDIFNPNWKSWLLAYDEDTGNNQAAYGFTNLHHDWNCCIMGGESDNYGFNKGQPSFEPVVATGNATGAAAPESYSGNEGASDPVGGAYVLASAPIRAAINADLDSRVFLYTNFVYYLTENYTKQELINWLQQSGDRGPNYANIAAVNAAWGSSYTAFASTGTVHSAEAVGTGNGTQTTFTHTLSNTTHITPESVQIFINGALLAGDTGSGARAGSVTSADTFMTQAAINYTSNPNGPYRQWAASHAYATGARIDDGNNVEFQKGSACTSGSSAPSWLNTGAYLGDVKTDGTCTWVNLGNDPLSSYGCTSSCNGTLNTTTGAISLTFSVAPESGAALTVTYTTGGWGTGTGLADEDGHNTWMPSDYYLLTGASSTMQTDLKNFTYHIIKTITQDQITETTAAGGVGYIYIPGNGDAYRCSPPRNEALAGESDGGASLVIISFPCQDPTGAVSDGQARLDSIEQSTAWPDKPFMSQTFESSNNDSGISSYTNQPPCASDVDFATRAAWGAYRITYMTAGLGYKSTNYNDYDYMGHFPWSWFDGANNACAWGVDSSLDDLNDGTHNGLTIGTDGYGLQYGEIGTSPTYAETRNNGNVVTGATTANQMWFTISGSPTVATPTFSPVAGIYTSIQTVTISTATSGAKICYTVNGSTPTESGNLCSGSTLTYTGPITVSTTETIQALGTLATYTDSSIASSAYTIRLPPSPPTNLMGVL
jgi:hypothetical protein